ncbi:MAG TPA: SBBP repeat-containing protein [Thermoanaerobaculia bacterium]
MRPRRVLVLTLVILVLLPVARVHATTADAYGKLPLSFEPNRGQAPSDVEYLSRNHDTTLLLKRTEAALTLRGNDVLRMRFVGVRPSPNVAGEALLQGKVNYLIGSDAAQWHTGIPTYRRVRYDDVWPGIDLVWHGSQRVLEYDLIVQPGSDPSRIRFAFDGARPRLDDAGNLIAGEVVQHAPVIYQDTACGRTTISGGYVLKGRREIGFALGAYDATLPLIIDPVITYSTFAGGTGADDARGIAVNVQLQAFITGVQGNSVYVSKLNAAGTDLIYSTLIGSSPEGIASNGIAVMSDGKVAITGSVINNNNVSGYPATANAFQKNGFCLGQSNCVSRRTDAFVTLLSADGASIVYSTFYAGSAARDGGDDFGEAIAVDSAGLLYITGRTSSDNLPMRNGFQASRASSSIGTDAFVAVFDPAQSGLATLLYASYLGGTSNDAGQGIAVNDTRQVFVGGVTSSVDLATKGSNIFVQPLQDAPQGGADGFVAKVNTGAVRNQSLVYLTYFGGDGDDSVEAIAIDGSQNAYITGATQSTSDSFPLLDSFDNAQKRGEAFVAKLNAFGPALVYGSFLGGSGEDVGTGIALDAATNAYVTGRTTSGTTFPNGKFAATFPLTLQGTSFLAKIEGPDLLFGVTLGGDESSAEGIAVDRRGGVYLGGTTGSRLPTTAGALQTEFGGGANDAFVMKIRSTANDTIGLFHVATTNDFRLRNSNTAGVADTIVPFAGEADDLPIAGDFDGDDHTDVGVFRPSTGQFIIRRQPQNEVVAVTFVGEPGDRPVIGDWDGDGFDTLGVFRDNGAFPPVFFLTNSRVTDGAFFKVELQFFAGQEGDVPLAGDWNGDGVDSFGFYHPSTSKFFLVDNIFTGVATRAFAFGNVGDLPFAGDWDGDDIDTVGVFRTSGRSMHLTDDFGASELAFHYHELGELPVAGNWDGH